MIIFMIKTDAQTDSKCLERREFLMTAAGAGIGSLLAGSIGSSLFASESSPKAVAASAAPRPHYSEVAKTTAECIATGEACVAHCARELGKGNTEMANCNEKVHDMLALTKAMLSLASSGSPLASHLASVCADACKACAEACAEHQAHFKMHMHLECKACMQACEACEKACRKIAA